MTSALKKRQRWVYGLTLVTALLIAAVGITLWWDKTNVAKNQLNLGDVNTMQWRRAGFDNIVFKRSDSHWQITSPCSLPVNPQRLEPLLDALENHGELYAAASVDLVATGLESPLATLVVNGQDVAIGEKDISGEYRYVKHGSNVALVHEWVLSLVNSGLTGVAELAVFNGNLSSLTRTDNNTAIEADVLDNENLASLSANQIVTWPIADMPAITGSASLDAMYQGGKRETLELTMTNSFTAIRRADSACAYLLQPDAMPDSLQP